MDTNSNGQVINGSGTFSTIAAAIAGGKAVLIAWVDDTATEVDLLISQGPPQTGSLQKGIRSDDVFFGVMGVGTWGFVRDNDPIDPLVFNSAYNNYFQDPTLTNLTALLNGIRALM
jgi:hypothetical protein